MTIKQTGENHYKKCKPWGAWLTILLIVITWLYILFEVIRG